MTVGSISGSGKLLKKNVDAVIHVKKNKKMV